MLLEKVQSENLAKAQSLAAQIRELDESLAEGWEEARTYSASSSPKSKDPAASAGINQSEWEMLSESEQRDWIRDWAARWRLDRGIHLSQMELERVEILTILSRLAGDHLVLYNLDARAGVWVSTVDEWKDEARMYDDAAAAMNRAECWPALSTS